MVHVAGQNSLWRKCCKPSVELFAGLRVARVLFRLSGMVTRHQRRAVNPAVEPLRAGTSFGSGATKKDVARNFTEFHEVHIFGMLVHVEILVSRIRELPFSQLERGLVTLTKENVREDKPESSWRGKLRLC